MRSNPDHPGAIHFYIHAVEASNRPERAEPYADRLARMDLGAGHLVHMPSHIYYRVGRYKDSLAVNKKRRRGGRGLSRGQPAAPIYAGGYYPHNIHFLMVSAQMAGDGPTAIEAAMKLEQAISDDAARTFPWVQPIKAAPLLAHAQFSAPDVILSLAASFRRLPVRGRTLALRARRGACRERRASQRRRQRPKPSRRLSRDTDWSPLVAGGLPAPDVLAIAREVVLGRIAQADGRRRPAPSPPSSRAAVIEDRLSYMEPPFWYYPVRQSLGAARLHGRRRGGR